jgi:hypothetical protein
MSRAIPLLPLYALGGLLEGDLNLSQQGASAFVNNENYFNNN